MRLSLRVLLLPLFGLLPLVLTGCSMSSNAPATPEQGTAIQGRVMGGQSPLVGAQLYLLQVGSGIFTPNASGYGNASTSLLTSTGSNTTLDTSGSGSPTNGFYYVTSDSSGMFNITNDYTCTPGAQVYLYSLGGGSGTNSYSNSAAGLLAALGSCPGGGAFSMLLSIQIDEVSTIATAYAVAGFATDALHVSSSGTPLAKTGMANAFANVTNMESLTTGLALTTTPGGGGTVPQAEINTLADILASCVNTTGPSSTACSQLFDNTEYFGSTGTPPSDTATAAINLAHNPGITAAVVYSLYGLVTPPAPFQPVLTSAPNDFTIALSFTGGGIGTPTAIAIDGNGDAWIANNASTPSVTELSPLGVALNSSPRTGGGLTAPSGVAVDTSGNVWVSNNFNAGSISEFNGSTGAVMGTSPFTGGGLYEPYGIAVDGGNNVWEANDGASSFGRLSKFASNGTATSTSAGYAAPSGSGIDVAVAIDSASAGQNAWAVDLYFGALDKFSNSGTALSGFSGYGSFNNPTGIAFDKSNNAWVSTHGSNVKVLTDTGTAVGTYTGGGLGLSQGIAIDGAGDAWIANRVSNVSSPGLLSEFSNSGAAVTLSTGYTISTMLNPSAIAIDGSGDVWVTNNNNSTVSEFIGAGVPVVTPLATGVANNTLGTRP